MAIGEVSENPSNKGVTRPTDPQSRDEDIERKLRLYGIFTAFGHGKFPTNKQIDFALTSAAESNMLRNPSEQLSPEGRELVIDLHDVIESAKYLWLKKNYNEEFQNFLYHTIEASTHPRISAPVDKDTAKEHGNQGLNGLRSLGRLLITNGQFRKLLEDATLLARDMAADGASNAAQKIRPDHDRLKKIDEPAEDHTWHENPPSLGKMKTSLKESYYSLKGTTQNVAQEHGQGVAEDASRGTTGHSDRREAGRRAAEEHASLSGVDQNAAAHTSLQSAKDRASGMADRLPDEHKEKVKDTAQSTKNQTMGYLKDKFPQERREQTIYRLKKMVVEIQQHEDYQEAIDTLISLTEEYFGHSMTVAKDTRREAVRSANDSNVQKAQYELKTLLENFADGTSMDDILDATDTLITDANNDPEFSRWGKHLNKFIRRCLKEDGFILKDETTQEWNELSEQGRYFLNDRYKDHTDQLNDEITRWLDYMRKDPDSVAFGEKVQKLFLDLGHDKHGNVKFKPHLLADVTDVIIPGFLENVRYVPIARIEVSDPKIDVVVENLVIESENLMPNILEIQTDAFFRFGRKKIQTRRHHRFSVHISQIQCDLKDVEYYINKKQGFPKIKDKGVMDIFLGGQGLSFDMKLATADVKDRNRIFKVENVKVKIRNFNVVLKQSNHKALFNFFKPLLMSIVKPAIAKAAEVQIRKSFDQLDEQMWLVQEEYNKAKEAAKDQAPEETDNMFNMYIQAVQKRITEHKDKAKRKTSDVKVNVATSKKTSILPNIRLPGGISTKAAKYRKMAHEGEEWRSPIFDIGSANAGSNIPAPKKITRKSPFQNSRATINDREGTATPSGAREYQDIGNTGGFDSALRGSGYQPRMSNTADSITTAVEPDDFEGNHVGKYNVTGSQFAQDPVKIPHFSTKDANVQSRDQSRQVV